MPRGVGVRVPSWAPDLNGGGWWESAVVGGLGEFVKREEVNRSE